MIICQNAMPEIVRTLDSLIDCDTVYICDGGSTDGTEKFLKNNKDRYKIKLFKRKFDTMRKQRNFLLSKIPKDSWIVNLDQDEALSLSARDQLREYLEIAVESVTLQIGKSSKMVFGVALKFYNLKHDFRHYIEPALFYMNRVFYYTDGVKFFKEYHCHPAYNEKTAGQYGVIQVPESFTVFHYVWFDKAKLERRKKRLLKLPKEYGENEYIAWFWKKHIIKKLPRGVV